MSEDVLSYKNVLNQNFNVQDHLTSCHKLNLYHKGLFPFYSKLLDNILKKLNFPKACDTFFVFVLMR